MTGYGQVCCPTPTHGQTHMSTRKELDSSLRMVSTAKHDQGNLPTDHECDVVQDAQGKTLIHVQVPLAQKAHTLTQDDVQPDDDKEERREVALRASTAPPGSIATFARPKDHATLTGMEIYAGSTTATATPNPPMRILAAPSSPFDALRQPLELRTWRQGGRGLIRSPPLNTLPMRARTTAQRRAPYRTRREMVTYGLPIGPSLHPHAPNTAPKRLGQPRPRPLAARLHLLPTILVGRPRTKGAAAPPQGSTAMAYHVGARLPPAVAITTYLPASSPCPSIGKVLCPMHRRRVPTLGQNSPVQMPAPTPSPRAPKRKREGPSWRHARTRVEAGSINARRNSPPGRATRAATLVMT